MDQELFRDIYYYRIQDLVDQKIRSARSIQESVGVTDKIFNFATNAKKKKTKKAKKSQRTDSEESINMMKTTIPKDKGTTSNQRVCSFYVKGDLKSCKKGIECGFKHIN